MHTVSRARSLRRASERGAAALIGAVAVAVGAGAVTAMLAFSQKGEQRAVAAGKLKTHAQNANYAALAMIEKMMTDQRVVQRPWNTRPTEWSPPGIAALGNNRYFNYSWNGPGKSLTYSTCNPPSFPEPDRSGLLNTGNLPTLTTCNFHAGNPVTFGSMLRAVVDTFQDKNNFPQNRFATQVRARTVYVPAQAGPPAIAAISVVNQAQINLPPPQPYCEMRASKYVADAGEPVTITVETVRGVTAAQWEAPFGAPGNPAGDSRVLTFPGTGNFVVGFRVTGLNGAIPPNPPPPTQTAGIFPATNPPQARCWVTIRVPPCRFKTAGYTENFNYPGHGNDIFGRGFNTTGGSNCFNWPNCNNPGKLALDIPQVPGYGGAANWNWLPPLCMDPTKQCVNVSLACRCSTPLASMVIHDFNKSTCTVGFIMWRPVGGCFTPETAIRMADGTTRRIDSLRPGDLVWNPRRHEPSVVRRVYRGIERLPLYEVFAGGQTIRVTELHVFETPDGPRQARDLQWQENVRLASGEWAPIDSLRILAPEDNQWVWNVDLEADSGTAEDHWLVSDGIVTGDMVVQKQLKEKRL